MARKGPAVAFATLLLVAQLLVGVLSADAATHAYAHHCGGCPTAASAGINDGVGRTGGDCGCDCTMVRGHHCGFSLSPALNAAIVGALEITAPTYAGDRGSVDLPDSPFFDLLRPPTRG